MRYGVIADVHANVHALDRVVNALGRAGIGRYLCLGDLVGYGPRPNECVERVRELDALTVSGNHDLVATGSLSPDAMDDLARQTLEWTATQLDPGAREVLRTLPRDATTDDGLSLAHGSLDDPSEYVYECRSGHAQLDLLEQRRPGSAGLLLGHTHAALACGAGRLVGHGGTVELPGNGAPFLLNPGSVGQPRERRPVARALVLDMDARTAEFLALDYDHEATMRELRDAGLPPDACHRPPPLRRRAIGAVRRYLQSP